MSQEQSKGQGESVFTAKKSQRFVSPRSLARKTNMTNFIKKKPSQIDDAISSSRLRFISPGKANLFVPQDSNNFENSLEFNYTQYSSNENINYPFIKRCASPKIKSNLQISTRTNLCGKGVLDDSSFLSNFLEPSFPDFSNCSIISDISQNSKLQQQVQELKKRNSDLNLQIELKNEHISKQKQQYDTKLSKLTKELQQIKTSVDVSEKKIKQTEGKVLIYQARMKELQAQVVQANQKLDKAEKEVKMYKAKFKLNYNTKEKEQQENKFKQYHQHCCGSQEIFSNKIIKVQENNFFKQNVLKDSKKINNFLVGSLNSPMKNIKSQKILTRCNVSTDQPTENPCCVLRIHQSDSHFNEYNQLKGKVQNLLQQIRYKDIEILTLKKTRCEFEKQKENYQKVKVFNNKLLSRVQLLTKQSNGSGIKKRSSVPVNMTPKKKMIPQDEDFDKQEQGDKSYETLQFELSPQRNFPQKPCLDEELMFSRIKMG